MNQETLAQALTLIYRCNPTLFINQQGSPSITLEWMGHDCTFNIDSGQFKDVLNSILRQGGAKLSRHALEELVFELASIARECKIKKKVYTRVGRHENQIVIDLSDGEGHFVVIDERGWTVKKKSPVPFISPYKQLPMPYPQQIDLDQFVVMFKELLNLKDPEYWLLILAFILKALHRDNGAYTILVIHGQQGSGKSTTTRYLKMLVDPSDPMVLAAAKTSQEIVIIYDARFLVAFDNMSGLNGEIADALCRTSTGGGISTRKLYENNVENVYDIQRPTILNGIDEPSTRADFVDRCVNVELSIFSKNKRVSEKELDEKFMQNYPQLLGGIYTLLSRCLALLPTVTDQNLPRMTEYARMGIAIERGLGLKSGTFLETYRKNTSEQAEEAFWSDDLCSLIFEILSKDTHSSEERSTLYGSSEHLLKIFVKNARATKKFAMPKTAKGFSSWLKRIEPLLKEKGIVVERTRTAGARNIHIYLEKS